MTFFDTLAAELRKAVTLRSLVWATLISSALMLAFAIADSVGVRERRINAAEGVVEGLTTLDAGLYGFGYFSFLPVIIAVLITASEYAGGQLTTSVLAAPRRGAVLAAKLVTITVATVGLGILQAAMILVFYQGRLGDISVFATGDGGEYLITLGLGVFYWIVLGLLSTSAAVLFRQQTGVLAVMVAFSFLSTPLLMVSTVLFQYLPSNSGTLMFMPDATSDIAITPQDLMGVGTATAVTAIWGVVAIIVAAIVFVRRDVGARLSTAE